MRQNIFSHVLGRSPDMSSDFSFESVAAAVTFDPFDIARRSLHNSFTVLAYFLYPFNFPNFVLNQGFTIN
ncbi:hypothetical protein H6G36_11690 [Anabaena minutissima FACHB-250]|nr:hypothetical protein [Anabaena minutissima FACHB-250]